MKILVCYGTRPEWIKLTPLVKEFEYKNIQYKLLFTGQHNSNINTDFHYDIGVVIKDGKNRLDSILKSICDDILFDIKDKDNITHVLVQGDTTTAMAIAVSAINNGIKVIHLEAGLRSYDNFNPYPEEYNRKIISQIADIHLCPTLQNKDNLLRENINQNVFVVGNTGLDNIKEYKDKVCYDNKILVTLHRRENHDVIKDWFYNINELAKTYTDHEFLLPIHPNPNVRKFKDILTHVKVVEPLPHKELLEYLLRVKMVITDSGGLQEECSFLNKKCLTCRKTTERPESVGYSTFLVENPIDIIDTFNEHINNYAIDFISPYGDGNSSKIIADLLNGLI